MAVEIASQNAHRLLTYIAAINDHGGHLPQELAERYAEYTGARPAFPTTSSGSSFTTFSRSSFGVTQSWISYYGELGWIGLDRTDNGVYLTPLGRTILRYLDQQEASTGTALTITLSAEDPLAYARMIGNIAQHDDALLVDAYLRVDALPLLLLQTRVTRFLTSRRGHDGQQRIAEVVAMFHAMHVDRSLELRASDEIHDRFVIPPNGEVNMLGTSIAGVGRRLSVYTTLGGEPANSIRAQHKRLWDEADVLYPVPEPTQTNSSEPEAPEH